MIEKILSYLRIRSGKKEEKISAIRQIDNIIRSMPLEEQARIIKMHIGAIAYEIPAWIKESLGAYLIRSKFGYTKFVGNEESRESLARIIEAFSGTSLSHENISLVNGGMQGTLVSIKTFRKDAKKIYLPNPGFNPYQSDQASMFGYEKIVPYNPVNPPVPKKKQVLLVHSINNPTGYQIPKKELEDIVSRARGKVIIDHAYWMISKSPQDTNIFDLIEYGNVLIVISSSKTFASPGIRAGAIIHPINFGDGIGNYILNTTAIPNISGQYFWQVLGKNVDDTVKFVYSLSKEMVSRLDAMYNALIKNGFNVSEPTGGLYLWVDVGREFTDDDAIDLLRKEFISVVPGTGFYIKKPNKRYVRISIGTTSRKNVEEAAKRLARYFNEP